jgi:hypothetical protein
MSTEYNPTVLQDYADKLYSQAAFLAFKYGFVFAVFTFVASTLSLAAVQDSHRLRFNFDEVLTYAALLAVGGYVLGFLIGKQKGFMLRLEAQRALCQMQIEANTRTKAAAPSN